MFDTLSTVLLLPSAYLIETCLWSWKYNTILQPFALFHWRSNHERFCGQYCCVFFPVLIPWGATEVVSIIILSVVVSLQSSPINFLMKFLWHLPNCFLYSVMFECVVHNHCYEFWQLLQASTALVCRYLPTEIFCKRSILPTFLKIGEGYVSACSGHVPLEFGLAAHKHKRNFQKVFCAYLITHLNLSLLFLRKCDNTILLHTCVRIVLTLYK